ncbi:PIN/TRAM domain-containing protein [Carnobacterium divergens]|uniref:PIN/TRAM domain-containing protein n=1 Tax=Carnobacterium divergens TaxID=2748 RepID=A0AAW8RA08_CARDV|nr:PIN/TRAM domain-containing protein [Carnobacterium divergens]MDO0874897.1 PIN/TRAM domain-containing protein [Carnobacterium divergens]MDT1958522.1 PIN/TRAM domain-containing protein [Carnobacterium divergens]MDT1974490.1 PIN/TRAM domain-containing protein [Carnobacterium divergens]MDT1996050.1 PIN/TRAM domain-containing protein [Carnobacterium divergens]MDT2012086.1 PIN/TRAM domain-containing protein [Carnobacterium divergens]
MTKKIITTILVIIGGSIGASFLPDVWNLFNVTNVLLNNTVTNILFGAIIFLLISVVLVKYIERGVKKAEAYLNQLSASYLLFGSIGTIIGLLVAFLVTMPLIGLKWPVLSSTLPILVYVIFAYLGYRIGTTRREEWRKLFQSKPKKNSDDEGQMLERKYDESYRKYKILDTSVIIDGRIYDIAKTGFIEGTLLIPNFVLQELQYIADSADSLKRVRGRRGLDILNALQKESDMNVEMYDGDFEDITEVDSKLIKLAKLLDGVVVTNDFNLNKVSEFQNVPVLNINELANAVKPVVIPGETMNVMVVKAGTERNQGVAYLDDGTMIVVEDGQFYMNKAIEVVVTSALQTAAGRMIFAKPVHAQRGIKDKE